MFIFIPFLLFGDGISTKVDRETFFQRIKMPINTLNNASVAQKPQIDSLQDCGILCSLSNGSFNSFAYDATGSLCILIDVKTLAISTSSVGKYCFSIFSVTLYSWGWTSSWNCWCVHWHVKIKWHLDKFMP